MENLDNYVLTVNPTGVFELKAKPETEWKFEIGQKVYYNRVSGPYGCGTIYNRGKSHDSSREYYYVKTEDGKIRTFTNFELDKLPNLS